MSPLVAFLIGSGRNIGQHTAAALKAKGYQVALGSRKPVVDEVEKEGYFPVTIDAHSVESVRKAFTEVNKKLGPPNVVIFNVASFVPPPTQDDPLTLPVEAFKEHTDMTVSLFAAAQEALKGFRSDVNKDVLKTFIYTGNPLPWAFYYASLVSDKGDIVEPISTFFSSGPQHAQRKDQADWEYRFTLDGKQWTK
ncbi:hypothetical protein B0H16DRAFT_1610827 [Mycena metata]|uniref:NAD(P)-binding protein n=1 Tax=Mycena metata TaxID=1033252 RepID=A0AAD7HCI5_9AGAR|nr:hypothetical protein B0H16DRAFT_1610827 [Mycena metata]